MSKIIQDTLGEDIEYFTDEDIQNELKIKNNEIEKLNEELEKIKDKDLNFSNLRKQKETAELKIEEIQKQIDDKINIAKQEVLSGVMKEHYEEILNNLVGNDDELKKKIEFNYNRIQDVPKTKSEILNKLKDAWIMTEGSKENDATNAIIFSSGEIKKINTKPNSDFSNEEKEFAKKLASSGGILLKDEDFK